MRLHVLHGGSCYPSAVHTARQHLTDILTDLLVYQRIELRIERPQELRVFGAVEGKVVALEWVLLQIEQLDIVQLEHRFQGERAVVLLGGEVARELVASVEHAANFAPLAHVWPQRSGLGRLLDFGLAIRLSQYGNHLLHKVTVQVGEHVVAVQNAVPYRRVTSLVGSREQRRKVLAGKLRGDGSPLFRRGMREAHESRCDVQVRSHRLASLPPRASWVHNDQGDIVLFPIRGRALGMQTVRAIEVAVVRSQHDNRLSGELQSIEFVQYRGDVPIHIAEGVQVDVVALLPAPVLIGDVSDQCVVGVEEVGVRGRATRGIETILVAYGQLEVPLLGIQGRIRLGLYLPQDI